MLPGFITLFRDNDNLIHLYFYKGLTDSNTFYYNDLDLSGIEKNGYTYQTINHDKYTKEYIFDNKNISGMTCKLMAFNGKVEIKKLKIK